MTTPLIGTPTLLKTATALGPIVRERRKSQSLRIDDAAGLLGVSADLMSRLENGQGSVRLDKALAVLDGLGLALMVLPKEHPWAREAALAGGSVSSESPSEPAVAPKA
jgi:transcriptional regulator with XRE-family HTH domain